MMFPAKSSAEGQFTRRRLTIINHIPRKDGFLHPIVYFPTTVPHEAARPTVDATRRKKVTKTSAEKNSEKSKGLILCLVRAMTSKPLPELTV